ncbi:MAG: YdcF family protein [Ruminococcaceae bacterium]|nr:YdcF family protein [Oscillospiraceae bacterium]
MTKIIDILKIIIGAAGWVWFMIPVVFSGIFNIGNVAGLLFFGVLFLWGLFGKKLREKARERKWAKAALSVLIAGYIAFTSLFIVESGFMTEATLRTPPSDTTVVVLGCAVYGETPSQMLRLRIEAAAEYLKENPEAKAVLSGGQGPNEDIPEALCMYRELVDRGIDGNRLYMEDRSTSTRENIAFSAVIIKENGLSENITIVTNNFHLYRATLSAEAQGFTCYCIPAYTPLPLLATYVMREYMGILAQWTVGD